MVALDTNILIDLWNDTEQGRKNALALGAMRAAKAQLVICGAVYVELHAHPGITRPLLVAELGRPNWSDRASVSIWRRPRQSGMRRPERTGTPASAAAAPGISRPEGRCPIT